MSFQNPSGNGIVELIRSPRITFTVDLSPPGNAANLVVLLSRKQLTPPIVQGSNNAIQFSYSSSLSFETLNQFDPGGIGALLVGGAAFFPDRLVAPLPLNVPINWATGTNALINNAVNGPDNLSFSSGNGPDIKYESFGGGGFSNSLAAQNMVAGDILDLCFFIAGYQQFGGGNPNVVCDAKLIMALSGNVNGYQL